jgi:hypothetical protein
LSARDCFRRGCRCPQEYPDDRPWREIRAQLLKLAVDPNVPAAVKARAAYYILTLGTKAMETEDIDVRVTELERAAELSKQGR